MIHITEDQLKFRQEWIDNIPDDGENLDEIMELDLKKWIEFCAKENWDAEGIDIKLGLA